MSSATTPTPAALMSALSGDLPVALLPVRLETLFANDQRELRIRVYPDAVHVHTFERELTTDEVERGKRYWRKRYEGAGEGNDAADAAWRTLAAEVNPVRAAFIARALSPTNLDALGTGAEPSFPSVPTKDSPWTLPPRAFALPERWVAVGYRGGTQLFIKMGAAIPQELAVGPAPDPEGDSEQETQHRPEAEQPELPIDDGMRWMTDYDDAIDVGMAITVTAADAAPHTLQAGVDRLIVVGVDSTREPSAATEALAELFEGHHYTEGLAFVRQGTPTNNTATTTSAYDPNEPELREHLDPAAPRRELAASHSGRRLARALGLEPHAFDSLLGADMTEDENAGHMNRALWEATWGYFLDHQMHPLVGDDLAATARDHFARFVRGRGSLPVLRVGNQPYGVLPVLAPKRFVGNREQPFEQALFDQLERLRGLWDEAVERAPGLAQQDDLAGDLLDVLETTPHSVRLRMRAAFGPLTVANTQGLTALAKAQETVGRWVTTMVSGTVLPHAARIAVRPRHHIIELPFVEDGELSERDGLTDNYLRTVADLLRETGGFRALQLQAKKTKTLLDALVRHAATQEVGKASGRMILTHRKRSDNTFRPPKKLAALEPELVSSDARTLLRTAATPFGPLSGRQSMADFVASRVERNEPSLAQLEEFIEALLALAKLSTAELTRLTAEELDACSYRLDAWYTSLAMRRLERVRDKTPNGIHLGGFGWVENLRPDREADSLGYVHAPSVAHATTAAILRSGHLAHRHRNPETLAIDLSSQRVQRALRVIEGVQQGQPFGALLGYRFERGIRERSVGLGKWILPFRRLAPLASASGGDDGVTLEAMAARDVVDGDKLVALWRKEREALFDRVPDAPPPTAPEKDGLIAELGELEALVDAVTDLLVAESVHQSATGNIERAAAAMDALDRQGPPPSPEVTRTPRTGTGLEHRVLVLLQSSDLPAAWNGAPLDARASVEPRLNAWVARALGDPARFRFAVDVVEDGNGGEPTVVERLEGRLSDLGLSPLSTVWAATSGAAGRASELEERVVHHLSRQVAHPDRVSELRLVDDRLPEWPADDLGIRELTSMARSMVRLFGGRRAALPSDLALATSEVEDAFDEGELGERAAAAVTALEAARDALDALVAAPTQPPAAIEEALLRAADLGLAGAVPADLENLEQAERVRADVARRLEASEAAADAGTRIAAVFGGNVAVFPVFHAPHPAAMQTSLDDRAALLADEPLAATTWLTRMAHVRPDVASLSNVLTQSEVTGADVSPTQLAVAQLPHRPGDRWLALSLENDVLPTGELGLVVHSPTPLDPAAPMAGIVVDQWLEVLPSPTETTGISFHYDAPNARAPQSVLLAVPPEPDPSGWDLETLLDTVNEALDLAHIRAVDPQRIWMVNRYLPAIYLPANARDDTSSVNLHSVAARSRAARTKTGGGAP